MAIWYILWSFWYSFPFLVCCTKINLATLVVHRTCAAETTTYTFLNKKDEFAWSLIHNEKNNGSLREYFHVAENSEAIAHARICRSSRLTGLQTRKEWSEKIEGQGGDTRGRCPPPKKKKKSERRIPFSNDLGRLVLKVDFWKGWEGFHS
jgi:hypothetical protein